MCCNLSKNKINGQIVLELNKIENTYIGGEQVFAQVHYQANKKEIQIKIKNYAIVQIFQQGQIQRQIILEGMSQIIKENEQQQNERIQGIIQFQSQIPQIPTTEFQTENPNKKIKIINFIEASLINQKNKDFNPKINEKLELQIQRSFELSDSEIIKMFSLPLKSWKLGDNQYAEIKYHFFARQFYSGDIISFTLSIDNKKSTIDIQNIQVYLIFEIIERKDQHWNILSQQIISQSNEKFMICSGISYPLMKFQLEIPNNCISSLYHNKFSMQYHVVIQFENEYNCFWKNRYIERILVDVVNK